MDDFEIKSAVLGNAGHILLNRPQALNALTMEMIRMLIIALENWATDDTVSSVLIEGAGDRAFCAGGDIKASYSTGMRYRRGRAVSERVLTLFYAEEYSMNRMMYHYKKPLISYMNGITMGGGFGVAGPCRYRIATEKTVFAMPETNIGFFPDVGGVWFLSRAPGQTGTYLVMTGNSIGPADMLYCGLATHYIPSGKWDRGAAADIESFLSENAAAPERAGELEQNRDVIDRCFAHGTAEEIVNALEAEKGEWPRMAAQVIRKRCPVSVKVALEHVRRAKDDSFDDVLRRDFLLAQRFMKGRDFYEGVRAAVIDKDRNPQWNPQRLEDITNEDLMRYFKPTGYMAEGLAA
ncbi:MAG: enoyl-CoA hydratase/isomerase family protein [Proteobacteria bacterium]|nr:enoyl-CoA hydratase/isomerase family protein [Pseudomonadota bacterium]